MQDFAAEANDHAGLLAGQSTREQTVMGLRVPNGFRDRGTVRDDLPRY